MYACDVIAHKLKTIDQTYICIPWNKLSRAQSIVMVNNVSQ